MGGGISLEVSGEGGFNEGATNGGGEELIMPGAPPITAGAKRPPGGRGLSSEPKGSNASILQRFSKARKRCHKNATSSEGFGSAHLTARDKGFVVS